MPIVLKSGSLNLLEPPGPLQACNGIALPSPYDKKPSSKLGQLRGSSDKIERKERLYLPEHALVSCTVSSSTSLSTQSVHLVLSERA